MPKRILRITSTSSIAIEHACLIVSSDESTASIPVDDMSVVVIETHRARITTAALATLIDAGVAIVHCDSCHMPNGLTIPFASHWKHAAIVQDQLSAAKPLQKRLWQKIVQAKIENQARVLDLLGLDGTAIRCMAAYVQSGDASNREAVAAAAYFKKLLPDGGRRDSVLSPALDYGYAIIRAALAREVVASGLLPAFGIHHESDANAFNLVDDLLEPFRPVVDLLAYSACARDGFTHSDRRILTSVLIHLVETPYGTTSVQSALEYEVESLRRAIEKDDADALIVPSLIPLSTIEIE